MSKIIKTGEPIMATVATTPPNPIPSITTTAKSATITPESPSTPTTTRTITKRIGGTTYEVVVHFSKTSTETISDKITRLIGRESFIGKVAG